MSKGLIFNIEEFAVHDGPGIRKLVFFKGCPLHCSWCHNPEGISYRRELMVFRSACINCEKCIDICDSEVCVSCGKCVGVCPQQARKICGEETDASDLAELLMRGKEILMNSGGGITVSGGEPLAQPSFLFDLISHLRPLNIAVETSGYASMEIFRLLVSEADLVLFDIKHTDPLVHKKYTGVDNSVILDNLNYLCKSSTAFHVRIPLIPGVNDNRDNMEKTALLIRNARNLRCVELLPYHVTAGAKYSALGKNFDPGFDTAQKVNIFPEIFKKYNIDVTVL
jgi:pyruvate formate lyase activating enzyme